LNRPDFREDTLSIDRLERRLGLGAATAAVAGEAIGVGIFLTPAGMARELGSPFWLLVVWLIVGITAIAGALSFGALAARFPEAGGGYIYLREAYGPRVAFLYGWMQLLVVDPGLTAALAVGLSAYAGSLAQLSLAGQKLLGAGVILVLAAVNIRQTRLGAGILELMTWLKFGALGLLVVWAVALRVGHWSNFLPFTARPDGSSPLLLALGGSVMAAFYSFGGWWEASKIAGEVREPERTMPRALTLGVLAVTLAYVLISMVFIYLVPFGEITSQETFMAQAGERLFGATGGSIMTGIVALCVLSSMAALLILSPRVYYAMARDGLFFQSVAKLHPRYGTPSRGIAVQALLASLLVALGNFRQIVAYFVFVAALFLGLTVAGLVRLARKSPQDNQPRVPGYPYTPLVFLALVGLLLLLLAARNPFQVMLGVAVVMLGVLAFELMRGNRRVSRARSQNQSLR
jgi:APA family basic amino acid/polyamine antiporter